MDRPGGVGQLQWSGYFSTYFFIDPEKGNWYHLTQQMLMEIILLPPFKTIPTKPWAKLLSGIHKHLMPTYIHHLLI